MSKVREIKEGLQTQGADEAIIYTLDTTPWGSSPSSITAAIFSVGGDGVTYTDVTATNMTTDACSADTDDIITLPKISGLTAGTLYRVEVKFTISNSIEEAYARILGER